MDWEKHTLTEQIEHLKKLALDSPNHPLSAEYVELFDQALSGNEEARLRVQEEIAEGVLLEALEDDDWGCIWT